MPALSSTLNPKSPAFEKNAARMADKLAEVRDLIGAPASTPPAPRPIRPCSTPP